MGVTRSRTDLNAIQAVSATVPVAESGIMCGALYGRRVTSPCRLTLAGELGGGLDGAWWPHSTSIARELPDLIAALREPLGQAVDIAVNWSPFEGVPDLDLLNRRGVAATPGRESRRLRVMAITGTRARADVLVVPWQTSTALAVMVLRHAAGLPILSVHQQTLAFQAAAAIVRAVRTQDARIPTPADISS
jgi:hypothetical protein